MRKKILALVTTIVMIFASVGFIVGCGDDKAFTAPSITLAYDNVVIGKGATYDLLDGVTVSDEYDSDIAVTVKDNGGFNKDVAGKYTVTYSATNSKSKEATATRTVEVAEGVLPAMDSYLKKGSALAVPTFSSSVSDAELTVSYKASGESDWTELSKTDGAYILDIAAGSYSVKYEAKKGKFEYTETVSVNLYSVAAPGNSVTIVGQNVTLGSPSVSDNVDGAMTVYARMGDADYAEIELDEASQSYKINNIAEGVTDVKYVVTVAEGVTEEVFCTVTAVNAQLSDTAIDRVSEAGEVTLRTPVVSTGVNVNVTATKIDYENTDATITDNKITVALGELYQITYAYTFNGVDLGSDNYMVYYPVTGSNVLDFDNWSYTAYSGAWVEIADKNGLNGDKSFHVMWYSGAMGNWHGYQNCNIDLGETVSKVTFYANAFHDFANNVGLWVSCKAEDGTGVSNAYSAPADAGTVDYVKFKSGWHKYTLDLKCSFKTLNTFTFYTEKGTAADTTDASELGVYIDGMYFHN